MQIHGPTHIHGPQSLGAPHAARSPASTAAPRSATPNDEVQISSVGHFLDRIGQLPDIRSGRVEQLRAAIAQGNYDSDDKLSVALDRLLGEIG